MGNQHSCCVFKSSSGYKKKDDDRYIPTDTEEPPQHPPPQVPSASNLQHISEREPDGMQRVTILNVHCAGCILITIYNYL